MAFPVPEHLPRKTIPNDVSSQILTKISDVTHKSLTADLASEWLNELELSIQQTKGRIYERIHEELPDFERQLESATSVQTRLRNLSTNVDKLSDSLSNAETGLLPNLLASLGAHSTLAQRTSNADAVHDALSYLRYCCSEFESFTSVVHNGRLPEGAAFAEKVLKLLEEAPEALAKADVMVDLKRQLRSLKDRVEEQLSEAYSRSVRISSTEFNISLSVQVRQSQTIISLQDILSSLSTISLNSHLASLRRDIVTHFIDFPLQQAVSSDITRTPEADGTPSVCLSLFPLPPYPEFRKSAMNYLKTLFNFLSSNLFPSLPPSSLTSFSQSLYRPTTAAILRDVLIPSIPSGLSALPSFLQLANDSVLFERDYFHARYLGEASLSHAEGDVETWARSVASHYGRKRRVNLVAKARALVLSSVGSGKEERVIRVEAVEKPEDIISTHPPEVIPVQGEIGGGNEDEGENNWDFDDAKASTGGDVATNGSSRSNEAANGKLDSEDENGWDFEYTVNGAPAQEPHEAVHDSEQPNGDEVQDDSDAWGWGDGDGTGAEHEDDSSLAPSGDDGGLESKKTNGHKVDSSIPTVSEDSISEDSAWDDAWDEPAPAPSLHSSEQPIPSTKAPKVAKRLEKLSAKGKEKGLASPAFASNSQTPHFTSPALPSSISSVFSDTFTSPRPDSVFSSSSRSLHSTASLSQPGPSKPIPLTLPLKSKVPETYIISERAQDLVRLISDIITESREVVNSKVFQEFHSSSPDSSTSASPSLLVLQAAPSALDLYRAVYPVAFGAELTRPERALRFSNDCAFVSDEATKLDLSDDAEVAVLEHMHESLERLRGLGEWWFDEGIERQRERVLQVLARAEGFVDSSDQERFDECEAVMSEVLRSVRVVANQWKTILARTKYYRATGQVVEAALTKILDDVLVLPDIPELDSRKLSELCRILNALEGLFVDSDDPDAPSMVLAYVPSWLKYSYLSELLEASIADIAYLFDEGALIDFRIGELEHLVRALFADTPLRANTISKIQRGHPVAVQ
ncbi:Centromere/kinetochore Zw10-domain-containing protein [Phellopilus nigrolimitatus]|nr:Centromere/kinetochore Zw10-domain-containing protein [Phellopilus nigrolimitatus]